MGWLDRPVRKQGSLGSKRPAFDEVVLKGTSSCKDGLRSLSRRRV